MNSDDIKDYADELFLQERVKCPVCLCVLNDPVNEHFCCRRCFNMIPLETKNVPLSHHNQWRRLLLLWLQAAIEFYWKNVE